MRTPVAVLRLRLLCMVAYLSVFGRGFHIVVQGLLIRPPRVRRCSVGSAASSLWDPCWRLVPTLVEQGRRACPVDDGDDQEGRNMKNETTKRSASSNQSKNHHDDNKDNGNNARIDTGTVKWFNILKGYGFILPDDQQQPDVFVHQSEIQSEGFRSLADGEPVEYQLVQSIEEDEDNERNNNNDFRKPRFKATHVTGPGGVPIQSGMDAVFRQDLYDFEEEEE